MLSKFKSADLFRKEISDYSHSTVIGGFFSIFSFTIFLILFVFELYSYIYLEYTPKLIIESDTAERINLHIDMTLNRITCSSLSIHYSDESSTMYTLANVKKYPINSNGILEGVTGPEPPEMYSKTIKCGDCYGAQLYVGQCCNSCSEVMEVYAQRG